MTRNGRTLFVALAFIACATAANSAWAVPVSSGLIYHLDAGAGVSTSGANVTAWADQSGNGNDFSQGTAANQPTFVASSTINSGPAIRFDGSNDFLIRNFSSTPQTVFIVNNVIADGNLDGIWGSSDPGDKGIRRFPTGEWRNPGDGNDFTNPGGSVMQVNGNTGGVVAQGVPHVLSAVRAGSPFNFTGNTRIGEYFGGRAFGGDIAEIAVYDRELTGVELHRVEGALALKYGLPVKPGRVLIDLASGSADVGGRFDLTDPESDGAADADVNYDANFSSTEEPGFGGGEFSFNAFDNRKGGGNNKWCCGGIDQDGHQLDAEIIAGQHFLTHFTLTSSNDAPWRNPTEFTIEGSNDGSTFDMIFAYDGSFGDLFSSQDETLLFEAGVDFPIQTVAYSTFRYSVTNTAGGSGRNPGQEHALGEIEYFGDVFTPVPEPATATLAMLGLGGLLMRRRRAA